MITVLNFPCIPRPRSIPVSEFFENEIESDSITPPYTILHRCDESTGCCTNMKHTCVVTHEKTVEVAFFLPKRQKFHVLHMKNHTACGCQFIRNSIK
ncbi:PDGF/VEGF domain [Popillia japonica]|uniref:PDGF/VEGF domain n=1 Tax=Popillia japonica TaxID=7064 RepID=A0AAW1N120_POPJA